MTRHTRNSLTARINSYPGPEVLGRINKKVLLEILEGRREKAEREYEQRMQEHNYYKLTTSNILMITFLTIGVGMIIGNILTTVLP